MEIMHEFVERMPEVSAVYGYGSGVFKQTNNNPNKKTNLDMIIVIPNKYKNPKEWHNNNMKLNKGDYSLIGGLTFKYGNENKIDGITGISYISDIEYKGVLFKYGTISESNFEKHILKWDSFYVPGRLQKPTLSLVSNRKFDYLIAKNRYNALMTATFLQAGDSATKEEILTTLCGLSYKGDTRMAMGEKPTKVTDIVTGSFEEFEKIYNFDDMEYLIPCGDKYIIDRPKLLDNMYSLPDSLLQYIEFALNTGDEEMIKRSIYNYLNNINRLESIAQMKKGIATDGFVKSSVYAYRKVQKRFSA